MTHDSVNKYKVVKRKRLGSVLVKKFSRTLPGVGLSPEYNSYSRDTMTRVSVMSHCLAIPRGPWLCRTNRFISII